MRKSGTHSARALGKKSAGKRGGRKRHARIPMIVLCALGVGILAAGYGATHQHTPAAGANAQVPGIAAPKSDGKSIAGTASTAVNGQATVKGDRLATAVVPKQGEITRPKADSKQQVAKKKKAGTAVAKAEPQRSFFDVFKPDAQQKH
jgi:hypothetical protein